MRDGE